VGEPQPRFTCSHNGLHVDSATGAALLVLVGAALAVVAAAGLHAGTPEVTATGYQLYTRLGSTPITRAEYLEEIARSQRLFAAIGFGLNVLVGACAVGASRDR